MKVVITQGDMAIAEAYFDHRYCRVGILRLANGFGAIVSDTFPLDLSILHTLRVVEDDRFAYKLVEFSCDRPSGKELKNIELKALLITPELSDRAKALRRPYDPETLVSGDPSPVNYKRVGRSRLGRSVKIHRSPQNPKK